MICWRALCRHDHLNPPKYSRQRSQPSKGRRSCLCDVVPCRTAHAQWYRNSLVDQENLSIYFVKRSYDQGNLIVSRALDSELSRPVPAEFGINGLLFRSLRDGSTRSRHEKLYSDQRPDLYGFFRCGRCGCRNWATATCQEHNIDVKVSGSLNRCFRMSDVSYAGHYCPRRAFDWLGRVRF
jgi:hypothetical protein